jgi:hypothetical protein
MLGTATTVEFWLFTLVHFAKRVVSSAGEFGNETTSPSGDVDHPSKL